MSTDTSPAAVEAMCKMLLDKGPNGGHFVQFGPEAAAMLRAVASERDEGAERYDALNTLMNERSAALGEMQDRALAAEAEAAALREALRPFAEVDLTGHGLPHDFAINVLAARAALKENHDGL